MILKPLYKTKTKQIPFLMSNHIQTDRSVLRISDPVYLGNYLQICISHMKCGFDFTSPKKPPIWRER